MTRAAVQIIDFWNIHIFCGSQLCPVYLVCGFLDIITMRAAARVTWRADGQSHPAEDPVERGVDPFRDSVPMSSQNFSCRALRVLCDSLWEQDLYWLAQLDNCSSLWQDVWCLGVIYENHVWCSVGQFVPFETELLPWHPDSISN